ncbi:MAG TPA: chemotaxis protein CheB [Terriglobia bacterium]|nr:chemotaxis protein CheB [Terriglobia bacterium]
MKKAAEKTPAEPKQSAASSEQHLCPTVGIGASAGGLEALTDLLKHLPADTGMGFIVVQHLAPQHQSMLTELLARAAKIPVTEATDLEKVKSDHVYVIPPSSDLSISAGVLKLKRRNAASLVPHLPVNRFFAALAEDCRNKAIGVVLSGTGSDGTLGLKAIKSEGGITFAQSEASAKFDGMPHSAIASGYADFILTPGEIARKLASIGRHSILASPKLQKEEDLISKAPHELTRILLMLRASSGVDFGHYKPATVLRRITRRMVVNNTASLAAYANLLKGNRAEMASLFQEMLISVTSFFREPDAFAILKREVFPKLMAGHRSLPLRLWTPGCSTGEEAYSLAICALEFLQSVKSVISVQVFATDISESALNKARSGRYSEDEVSAVSPERLSRFFKRVNGDFQIDPLIREMCVFARQDVIKDPPFSRLDLISCRNLLIYLDRSLQQKLIPVFHYALQPRGFLLLGKSESIEGYSELFKLADKESKLYARKGESFRQIHEIDARYPGSPIPTKEVGSMPPAKAEPTSGLAIWQFDLQKEIDRVLLADYTPAAIVVNDELEIVQFHGHTGPYLDPKPGPASLRLPKVARAGLAIELRAIIHHALKSDQPVIKRRVRIESSPEAGAARMGKIGPKSKKSRKLKARANRRETAAREITIEVKPLHLLPSNRRYFLILFREETPARARGKAADAARPGERGEDPDLRRELSESQEALQDAIDQLETSNEELRAANEEVQSNNEELQTANEELEASKEELQAANEELGTLNDELISRNAELSTSNNDLNNIIGNITLPMIVLGSDRRIRRFTQGAQEILHLFPSDVGRPLTDLRFELDFPGLEKMVKEAVEAGSSRQQHVTDRQGHSHMLMARPYKTAEERIEGAVITLLDIDYLTLEATDSRLYSDVIIEMMWESLLVLDADLRVKSANRSFFEHFELSPSEIRGHLLYELSNGQWNIPRLLALLRDVLPVGREIRDYELGHDFPHIGRRTLLLNAREIRRSGGSPSLILVAIRDVTERDSARRLIEEQAKLLDLANDVIIVRDLNGAIKSWNHGAERAYGWTRGEALGKITHSLLKTQPAAAIEEMERKLLHDGSWEGELTHTARDGSEIIMASRQVLQRGDGGKPEAIMEINRDVTQRKHVLAQLEKEQNALRELSGRVLRLQDEERRGIARDLHDSTAQTLTVLAMNLARLGNGAAGEPARAKLLVESQKLAAQASDEIRNLSHLLHPPDLDSIGLVPALRWFIARFIERSGIKVDLDLPPGEARFPQEVEIALFRVAQESLGNVHRHSGSKVAKVRLMRQKDHAVLEVEDRGCGIPGGLEKDGKMTTTALGIGIAGMQERLRQLGGSLEFISSGQGTTVKATVPVKPAGPKKPAPAK